MRYPIEHKDQSRTKIVAAGGRHAKKNGFATSSVADLAAAAGVTTGAVYKHFSGKSDFLQAMLAAELQRTANMYANVDPDDEAQVARVLSGYLSMSHVKRPDAGCPLPSLTSEIARADDVLKQTFEAGLISIHNHVKNLTGNSATAWTLMAQNIGAVMLARALQSEILQQEILDDVREAGADLLKSKSKT